MCLDACVICVVSLVQIVGYLYRSIFLGKVRFGLFLVFGVCFVCCWNLAKLLWVEDEWGLCCFLVAFCVGFSSTKSRIGLFGWVCFGVLFGFSALIECRWKLKKEKKAPEVIVEA